MPSVGRISIIVLFLFGLMGCSIFTSRIDPRYVPLGNEELKRIQIPNPVALINANEDKVTKITGKWRSHDTNLRDWTDVAIIMIKEWFAEYGVPVVPDAPKKLTLEIVNAKLVPDTLGSQTSLQLVVKTGEGDVKVFPATGGAGGLDRAAGYAINYSVAQLIEDGTIAKYIAKQ